MNITAFAASSSLHSINRQLVEYTLTHFPEATVNLLDLNDFEMPLFSVDRESSDGYPQQAYDFLEQLKAAGLTVVSMAEHNGQFTAAFKNILDWCSRVELKLFGGKPMLLMSTSPGGYGGRNALQAALARFPKHGADIVETFSLPSFHENFTLEQGIQDEDLKAAFLEKIEKVKERLLPDNLKSSGS